MSLPSYYRLRTFGDIVNAVIETLRVQSTDTNTINRIKRNINTIYTNQVASSSRSWSWMNKTQVVSTQPYYCSGTVSCQQNVPYITFSTPVPGSRKGWFIMIDGASEIHQIFDHTDLDTVATLTTRFIGVTNVAARFRIFSDSIPLPVDCQNIRSIVGSYSKEPLEAISLQMLRTYQLRNEGIVGKPMYYAEGPRVMPAPYQAYNGLTNPISRESSGAQKTLYFSQDPSVFIQAGDQIRVTSSLKYEYEGNVRVSLVDANNKFIQYTTPVKRNEANTAVATPNEIQVFSIAEGKQDPYPTLVLHPSIDNFDHISNLVVDYQAYPEELLNDADEPAIPLQHRQVLFFGAMWMSSDRDTDLERAQLYKNLMDTEIQRLISFTTMPMKLPRIEASKDYIRSKLRTPRRRFIIG